MPVHKIILAAYSEFFENMFTANLNGINEKEKILRQIEPNALELIIDFMYTAKLQINEQNVQVKLYFKIKINWKKTRVFHKKPYKCFEGATIYVVARPAVLVATVATGGVVWKGPYCSNPMIKDNNTSSFL